MTGADGLDITHYGPGALPVIRRALLDIYGEVLADRLADPFHSVTRFGERLAAHAALPGWEVVVGYDRGRAVGYVYGAPLPAGSDWWSRLSPGLSGAETAEDGTRTLALYALFVRRAWRGTGAVRRLHDELLGGRSESRVTLMVEADRPRLRELYEGWGYAHVGDQRPGPGPGGAVYATLLRARERAAASGS
ncbi:GNAT family N-acetyltransferase [Streptomyces gamaensis]|uniref:GNAT family N-acetyltransferase n=1 Tax=Streptomyces gamaensis TaxID=1763542 RepID=A0ABW0YX50_9ACTN